MSRRLSTLFRAIVVFALLFVGLVVAGSAQQTKTSVSASAVNRMSTYPPVTAERLKKPEDGNWLSIRRTYDGWGFSPLKEITTANVTRLKPVWNMRTGEDAVHE